MLKAFGHATAFGHTAGGINDVAQLANHELRLVVEGPVLGQRYQRAEQQKAAKPGLSHSVFHLVLGLITGAKIGTKIYNCKYLTHNFLRIVTIHPFWGWQIPFLVQKTMGSAHDVLVRKKIRRGRTKNRGQRITIRPSRIFLNGPHHSRDKGFFSVRQSL